MRKRKIGRAVVKVAVLLAFAACLISLISDLHSVAQSTQSMENKIRISAVMPHRDDGYWTYVVYGAQDGGTQYADQLDVKVYYPQLNYNVDQMTALIKRQIAAKVDAIIVQGNEDKDYQQALTDAWNKGIQIVLVDTDIIGFVPHLYIGTDNYVAGQELGRRLAELTGGKANVAVLSGQPGYHNLDERYRGLTEIAQAYPEIRFMALEYDNFDSLTVLNMIEQIKTEKPDINTLVCIEGTGGQAVGNHYTKYNKKFSHILAFDNMEETLKGLRNGTIDGVEAQEPYQMGFLAVEYIAKKVMADKQDSYYVYTSIRWLTPETQEQQGPAYGH